MRKRIVALILMASTVLVLLPSMADASSDRRRTCIRVNRGGVHVVIGYCP
jgi:hypothetical protein